MTGALAWAGIVGPALFAAVFLVLGAVKPGYDARARFVSEGSVGELGWIQIVNFVVLGAALLVFAAALWNSYGDDVSGRIGAGLMAAVSVGLIFAGVFVTDAGIKIVAGMASFINCGPGRLWWSDAGLSGLCLASSRPTARSLPTR